MKKRSEYLKEWAHKNPDKIRAYALKYKAKNLTKVKGWNHDWIEKNREQYNLSKYRYKDAVKVKVLLHYGEEVLACKQCGFSDVRALCLDHIKNDGAVHRKQLGISARGAGAGARTYGALLKAGLPAGLQILCANCNMVKEQERHLLKRMENKLYESYYNSSQLRAKTVSAGTTEGTTTL